MYIQYWTAYLESLGPKAFRILGDSGFFIFAQGKSNTEKINNKNFVLRYALSKNSQFVFCEK
jgi:hypothetical protein